MATRQAFLQFRFLPPYFASAPDFTFAPTRTKLIRSLGEFKTAAALIPLDQNQQKKVVEQALILMRGFYVHRFLKQTLHNAQPIHDLSDLQSQVNNKLMDSEGFHGKMLTIFRSLQDRHTAYFLPLPYRASVMFLPFLIEEYYDKQGARHYVISKVANAFDLPQAIRPGAVITRWNDVPMEQAIELIGQDFAGSHDAARHALGLQNVTIRPLISSLLPDQDRFSIEIDGACTEVTWQVWMENLGETGGETEMEAANVHRETLAGIDGVNELVRRVKRALFVNSRQTPWPTESLMPDVFRYKPFPYEYEGAQKRLGYIRIFTFDANYVALLYEFMRMVEELSTQGISGLIIDVRGNGGGFIPAVELLLQLLKGKEPIQPQQYEFVGTPETGQLCDRLIQEFTSKLAQSAQAWEKEIYDAVCRKWNQWKGSIDADTGRRFSDALPLAPDEGFAYARSIFPETLDFQQLYRRRVLLITDALSYSATDMFAAGFQDNGIGRILGTSNVTGGGGANVWLHSRLAGYLTGPDSGVQPLGIKEPTFAVAVRRARRTGTKRDVLIEDHGVTPDCVHQMTERDLTNDNQDLLERAASILFP